jgi:hypothetical protein
MGKTALVIAHRNEPDIDATIADARVNMRGVQIYAIEDINGEGPGYCRHKGIMQAIAEGCTQIIITDAHMRFGAKAISLMAGAIRENRFVLHCGYCHHNPECSLEGGAYAGAELVHKSRFRLEHLAISAKWARPQAKINAVMGAFYGLSDQWYLQAGQPLRILRAWGMDEEVLSICANLMHGGGVAMVEGCHVAHRMKEGQSFPMTAAYLAEVWANRVKAAMILPCESKSLSDWVLKSPPTWHMRKEIDAIIERDRQAVEEVRAALELQNPPILAFLANMIPGEGAGEGKKLADFGPSPVVAPPALPPKVVQRVVTEERCDWCGNTNSFVQQEGQKTVGQITRATGRCKYCGRKVQIRVLYR